MFKANVSNIEMRQMLARSINSMRLIRSSCLVESRITEEDSKKYGEQTIISAGFVDPLELPDVTKKTKASLFSLYERDPALRTFDPLQMKWWMESDLGKEFAMQLAKLTAYSFRGEFRSEEDLFHYLQILKHIYADQEERVLPDFLHPAYGRIEIPKICSVASVIVGLSGIKELGTVDEKDRLTLRVSWYPDDNARGLDELEKLMEIASQLGYAGFEFWMPKSLKYEQLSAKYGNRLKLKTRDDGEVYCRVGDDPRKSNPEVISRFELGELDFEQLRQGSVSFVSFSGEDVEVAIEKSWPLTYMAKSLFAIRKRDDIACGAFFHDPTSDFTNEIPAILSAISDINETSLVRFMNEFGERIKAKLAYVNAISKGREFTLEAMSED